MCNDGQALEPRVRRLEHLPEYACKFDERTSAARYITRRIRQPGKVSCHTERTPAINRFAFLFRVPELPPAKYDEFNIHGR
jgi:hypothetical protein